MVPRLGPGVKVKKETEELVLDLAENLYPGVDDFGQLDKPNRGYWLRVSCGILREYPDITQYLDTLSEVLARGINAEIDDILQRLEADLKEKERRSEAEEYERGQRELRDQEAHEADMADQEQRREERIERLEWQGKREANGWWIERILAAMMIIAFVVAVGLLVAAGVIGHTSEAATSWTDSASWSLAVAGSGATGLLSLIMLALYRMRPGFKETESSSQPTSAPASLPEAGDAPASAGS